jgi:hypothetical protein
MRWSVLGGIMVAVLAGCERDAAVAPPKDKPHEIGTAPVVVPPIVIPPVGDGPIGADLLGSSSVIGGVIFRANGEFVVVDAAGNEVVPCTLPDPGHKGYASTTTSGGGECQKVSDTTITSVQSIAAVRHTGSHCLIVGPVYTVSAGGVVTSSVYQLPPGCRH